MFIIGSFILGAILVVVATISMVVLYLLGVDSLIPFLLFASGCGLMLPGMICARLELSRKLRQAKRIMQLTEEINAKENN